MTSKKLGALLRSVPPATAVPAGDDQPVPAAASPAIASPTLPDPAPAKAPAPVNQVEAEVPLQVRIPAGVHRQLAIKAAEQGESLRTLVLRALRSTGVEISDADVQGKRGRRSA